MISAGGTGGGVYPALVVAGALRTLYPDDLTLTFVGARGDMAFDMVDPAVFDGTYAVLAGPLHGVSRLRQLVSLIKILGGVGQSLLLAIRQRPQVLFLTGGWVGFPMAAACWLLRRPIVIFVPDVEPGLALRLLGRYFARVIAATVKETAAFYPGKNVVETGYPLRPQMIGVDRAAAIQSFDLDPARPIVLVWGGSRGSRSINTAFGRIAPDLLADGVQIIHVSGALDFEQVQQQHASLGDAQKAAYRIFQYMPDIERAFAAADLVISRAGARRWPISEHAACYPGALPVCVALPESQRRLAGRARRSDPAGGRAIIRGTAAHHPRPAGRCAASGGDARGDGIAQTVRRG
jgi:UDP-N-acetylglucosamine--N-acetylmuramyl-(pentapeptide) pyrophosphoryl-undecaprenol N-acetylglucosamine transferase